MASGEHYSLRSQKAQGKILFFLKSSCNCIQFGHQVILDDDYFLGS